MEFFGKISNVSLVIPETSGKERRLFKQVTLNLNFFFSLDLRTGSNQRLTKEGNIESVWLIA